MLRVEVERRLDRGLLVIGEQMEALAQELATTVEKVREDAVRARIVESLGQALDLDEVLARCAEAATSLHGVAGATVAVRVDGVPLSASAGLAVRAHDIADAGAVGGPPDGSRVRAVGISYHYPAGGEGQTALRSAVAVPVESESGHLGFLAVFGRDEEPPVAGRDFQALETIVRHTGPAIEAARQRGDLRRLSDADGLTGLEANLRFGGPETMETKIFGRLTAWQNWIFQRPNAVGAEGALRRYGTGLKGDFNPERV